MKRIACFSLCLIVILTTGCYQELDRDQLRSELNDVQVEVKKLHSAVDKFDDGSTNWSEIVPEVKSSVDDLDGELADIESELYPNIKDE